MLWASAWAWNGILGWAAPPGDVARVARLLRTEELRAHDRVDAVRAHEQLAPRRRAVGERDRDAPLVLVEGLHAGIEVDARAAERAGEHVEQVGAVGVIV